MKRIAIIGAGPIGLDAALAALEQDYAVEIFERGQVANAVGQWGHVRMFSPFGRNVALRGRKKLSGAKLPGVEELLTGAEFRDKYLLPLANTLPRNVLHENTIVAAIGRNHVLKGDHIGHPERGETAFRLLVSDQNKERIVQADVVLDCSGTYGQPNRLGHGGIPAPGEGRHSDRIFNGVPDVAGAQRERYRDERVLVVGAGHSGATVVTDLARLPAKEIHWLLRGHRALPASEIPNDPLPERARLAERTNKLVAEGHIHLHRAAGVEAIHTEGNALRIEMAAPTGPKTITVDEIVATTGFHPDLSLARELQGQTCWATEGTYPLAASLLGEAGADCLKTPSFGAEMLMHPEPNYFVLGMKSYGRGRNFLLRAGYEQVEMIFDHLSK